jgi:hypothetical protein
MLDTGYPMLCPAARKNLLCRQRYFSFDSLNMIKNSAKNSGSDSRHQTPVLQPFQQGAQLKGQQKWLKSTQNFRSWCKICR